MSDPHYQRQRKKFQVAHGSNGLNLGDGWIVFSDGAMMEWSSYGIMCDPPEDLEERLKLQIAYREEALSRVTESFQVFKNGLRGAINLSLIHI